MGTKLTLYASKQAALQAGCDESDLSEDNGVVYCSCSCKPVKKEEKVVRTTKELKVDKKSTKDTKITKKHTDNGNI